MSKYNKGDRFIVEVKEVMESKNGTLYRGNFSTLTFDDYGLDKLEKYNEIEERLELIDALKQAEYNRGREEALQEVQNCENYGYEKGLQDAWELAKGLYLGENQKYSDNQYEKIFGGLGLRYVFDNYSPQQALAKLEAYEKEQEQIKVGDVVEMMGHYCIITSIDKDDKEYDVLWSSGVADSVPFDAPFSFTKTGKHIDIASLLAKLGKE